MRRVPGAGALVAGIDRVASWLGLVCVLLVPLALVLLGILATIEPDKYDGRCFRMLGGVPADSCHDNRTILSAGLMVLGLCFVVTVGAGLASAAMQRTWVRLRLRLQWSPRVETLKLAYAAGPLSPTAYDSLHHQMTALRDAKHPALRAGWAATAARRAGVGLLAFAAVTWLSVAFVTNHSAQCDPDAAYYCLDWTGYIVTVAAVATASLVAGLWVLLAGIAVGALSHFSLSEGVAAIDGDERAALDAARAKNPSE